MVSSHEVLRTLASPQLLIIFHVLNLCLAPHEGVCNVNPTHLYQLKLLDEVKIEHIKILFNLGHNECPWVIKSIYNDKIGI